MKVSIITVCRNSEKTINSCISSVLSQSYTDIEHIVVDGASSDGTLEAIHRMNLSNLDLISEPDQGVYDAMNKGVGRSTGDIICFLNSDDIYSGPEVIKDVVHEMTTKNLDVLLTDVCFVSKTGEVIRNYTAKDFVPRKLDSGWMPPHPGMFVSRKKMLEAGLFNKTYKIAGDYEFCIKLFGLPDLSWSYHAKQTVRMALGGLSSSGIRSQYTLNREVYRACLEHGIKISFLKLLLKYPKKTIEFVPIILGKIVLKMQFKRYFHKKAVSMDDVIDPEILNDPFASWITDICGRREVRSIVEIGSSSGDGSTQAILRGLVGRADLPKMVVCCLELSGARFKNLVKNVSDFDVVYPYNLPSVSSSEFPSETDVERFLLEYDSPLKSLPVERVLGWLRQDMDYVRRSGADINGISAVKLRHNIDTFDAAIIDGSEFTGAVELQYLLGAKYILLDDTETFKCRSAYEQLSTDVSYNCVAYDPKLRNGYAIFERIDQ